MLFKKKRELNIQDAIVAVHDIDGEDYLSLTDMVQVQGHDSSDHIRNWMRNRNTVEFLGLWECMNNPNFKPVEFEGFKKEAGLNSFNLSPKKWVDSTNAKGIIAKSGRYGGTYAHKDIAFEFGTWISPIFKLYLIKEYQRLKEIENNQYNLEWNVKRVLSKANYQIHTDAVETHIIPTSKKWRKELEYAEEADVLNVVVFGSTAKEWRDMNPEHRKNKENIRDVASINELMVLSNIESMNAEMIRSGMDRKARFEKLQEIAKYQLEILNNKDSIKALKKRSEDTYLIESKKEEN
ncbi:MAG: KilA-N domain-containing protein [Alphaproteobacteria bacterium]|nr:KilA-N domain-containing protein [Alphaproteobacteria bacterium]